MLRSINQLLGEKFFVSYYQRGYRWTDQQVNDLLDDIWTFANNVKRKREFYCLQPIVVKVKQWNEGDKSVDGWEVIDGQQRITTIHIILNYLAKEFLKVESLKEDYGKELFTIHYQMRPGSETFLKNIHDDRTNSDFYYMNLAYHTVSQWFTNGQNVKDRSDRDKFLRTILGKIEDESSVQVIWYQVEPQIDSIELFARLNIGKIPLTNSELIKALFLSSSSFENDAADDARRKKIEISLIWDQIELELANQDLWAFMSNADQALFPNKIELLFDMIVGKKSDERDPLFTFIHFIKQAKHNGQTLWSLWLSIEKYYQTLSEWFRDKNLYHKTGYLIAIGVSLKTLISRSLSCRKDEFERSLDEDIRKSVSFDLEDLSYEDKVGKKSDYTNIMHVLLLLNVESIRRNKSINERYPFRLHKSSKWSIEHIHAQKSKFDEGDKKSWLLWLSYHESLIQEIMDQEDDSDIREIHISLLKEINALSEDRITYEKFNDLSQRIVTQFTEGTDSPAYDLHGISNLALLSQPDNSALNNSVFEVKRREIIRLDQRGEYIPLCTRRVFFKYYNPKPENSRYCLWDKDDRRYYMAEIKTVLKEYLPTQQRREA